MNDDVVKLIKNTEWHSDWSGPFSLFGLSLPTHTYFGGMEKYFGKGLSGVFVVFKNGIAFSRLPHDDYHALGVHLVEKTKDPSFLQQWGTQFKETADRVIEAIPASIEEFIKKLPKLIPLYQAYGAHNAATKIAFDIGNETLSIETKALLEDARKYSEHFYKNDADMLEKVIHFIAEASGYAYEEIFMLTYDEFTEYLATGRLPSPQSLQERWVASGIYFTRDATFILSPSEVEEIERERVGTTEQKELRGQVAYRGKVQGKCRIVLDYAHSSLEEGEILVTGMTDPNFVELMKKASAIITDGGGMLSHAAIVARELKTPCVVGTKIATQVLKDGDFVEVDAERGVVRILQKA